MTPPVVFFFFFFFFWGGGGGGVRGQWKNVEKEESGEQRNFVEQATWKNTSPDFRHVVNLICLKYVVIIV